MAKLYNLARMTVTSTGTGTITLGSAVAGFLSFASSGIADGDTVTYAIEDGANSEIGRGVYTSSGTTLTRSVLKSTSSNTPISVSTSAQVFITAAAEDLLSVSRPGGRITLTTAVPVLTSTVSGATTVYYTPHVYRMVPIYDGTSFTMHDVGGELSQATTDSTKSPAACTTNSNYDLFVWNDSGTYRCTRGPAWSSSTARGTGAGTTELELVRGIYLNKVAITNGPGANRGTYVGTIRTNGSSQVDWTLGTSAAGGGAASLGVWNAYNRTVVATSVADSTASWSYTTSSWRAANNSTGNRVSAIVGLNEDACMATYLCQMSANGSNNIYITVTLDGTTTGVSAGGIAATTVSSSAATLTSPYTARMGIGWHFLQACEFGNTVGNFTAAGAQVLTFNFLM